MPPIERLCAIEASIIVHAANSSSYPAGTPEIASLFGMSIDGDLYIHIYITAMEAKGRKQQAKATVPPCLHLPLHSDSLFVLCKRREGERQRGPSIQIINTYTTAYYSN